MMIPPPAIGSKYFALKDTTLSPRMLLGRARTETPPWVLRHPAVRYHYLGRNASHALVKGLGLSGAEMLFPAFFTINLSVSTRSCHNRSASFWPIVVFPLPR